MVLEASLSYTASCSVVVMDEVADLNERVDVEMREVEEDIRELKGTVVELREELREVREAHSRLSCKLASSTLWRRTCVDNCVYHELLKRGRWQGLRPT